MKNLSKRDAATTGKPSRTTSAVVAEGDPAVHAVVQGSESEDSEEERVLNGEQPACFACTDGTPPHITHVVDALSGLTKNLKLLSTNQTQKTKRTKQKLVAKLIAKVDKVVQDLSDGTIVLPDPGEGAIWVLVDSGSSITVADKDKHFPGAQLVHDKEHGSYQAATGQSFKADGHFRVDFRTENKHKRSVEFINAPVSMPILSVKRWNSQGNRTSVEGTYGLFVHKETGEEDYWVARSGVYVVNMYVHDKLLRNPNKHRPFGRRGTD